MENFIEKHIDQDAHFIVSLDGLNLTDKQVERINRGIQDVVLKEVASIDRKGDLVINESLQVNPKLAGIRFPHTMGIWIEDFDRRIERFNLINRPR